jgi:diphthamide biosynthesis protein 3
MSDDEGISIYDEVEIEDMTFDEAMGVYQFPCPCGDKFQITLEDLLDEQDIAVCPSCSLMIRVIFDLVCFVTKFCSWFSVNNFRMTYQSLPLQATRAARFL